MRRGLLFTLFLFLTHAAFGSKEARPFPGVTEILKKNIQKPIAKVLFEKNSKSQMYKILGQPDDSKDGIDYYEVHGIKYDLNIIHKNGKLNVLWYQTSKSNLRISDFAQVIKEKKLKVGYEGEGHERGRKVSFTDPSSGLKLIFRNNSKKTLHSIHFDKNWKK